MSFKYIGTKIDLETHEGLRKIAEDRGVTLTYLYQKICGWAAKQSPLALISLGIDLPVFVRDKLDENG